MYVQVVELGGIALVAAGIYLIYPPAALIALGLGLVFWAQGSGR